MDAFKDRLSQRARDTTRPALAHQSLGRPLTDAENALAAAMMDIMGTGQHDFAKIAAELAARGVVAPISGRTDWDVDLFASELSAINADLDAAYAEHGYGA
ncbi:recombinase-like helix-turn-helix domain-containing protein [Pararhodobacter sp.]|uniref:recombinase-like helix-turn-helix domain-containing protein n=1 Tax=Pararhodobacter sp. TaxID=2127056 RepID=UPI002AFF4E64|nr:recombinase-like helix-turn-helix domain-containing protein [Pararhodobacter sp.]